MHWHWYLYRTKEKTYFEETSENGDKIKVLGNIAIHTFD